MMDPDSVKSKLLDAFPDAEITLLDLTGTQDHYEAVIISRAFEGKSLVVQHQMVYRALGSAMHGPIHALALKTSAPQRGQLLG
jgi:stress-induced morphogen